MSSGIADYVLRGMASGAPLVRPDKSLVFTGATAATIDTTGHLVIDAGANGKFRVRYDDIIDAYVYAPSTAAKKKVQIDLSTLACDASGEVASVFIWRQNANENVPYEKFYVKAFPADCALTAAEKIAAFNAEVNGDPDAIIVATANSTTGIFLEAKVAGEDIQISAGGTFSGVLTETVAPGFAWGTGAQLKQVGAFAGAVDATNYNLLVINYKQRHSLGGEGLMRGNKNENRAFAYRTKTIWIAYATSANDSDLATAVAQVNPTEARFKRIASTTAINA